ncbi:AAA family ATPase [Larkinella terrae]|uniref:AAA domain-containing protein n=1 Tax=Larkinella terrae TaxID=2025311 RepID=A0A7K0EMQ0_9BACT|nr:MoxR family ATPase [Larkinella terrae]MRS62708.1 AAA domain-containing protein [Larkinella terrae]
MSIVEKFEFDEKTELNAPRMEKNPSDYILDSALYNAVRVAILLKQPLLLTGEPGTGKTRLAEKLAADLHAEYPTEYLSKPLVFNTKTVSTSTDLFYLYDALGHFHSTHFDAVKPAENPADVPAGKVVSLPEKPPVPEVARHIRLQALGQAIVLSNQSLLEKCPYLPMKDIDTSVARSSVVLIDEVDKAPRDFANDLLNELDRFRFQVREDGNEEYAIGTKNIFVILTSNSEKSLPDAFLRRCVFYHIEFPKAEQLQEIVLNQIFNKMPELQNDETKKRAVKQTITDYVNFFVSVTSLSLKKKPATAELISWIYYLREDILNGDAPMALEPQKRLASYSILAKHAEDLELLKTL